MSKVIVMSKVRKAETMRGKFARSASLKEVQSNSIIKGTLMVSTLICALLALNITEALPARAQMDTQASAIHQATPDETGIQLSPAIIRLDLKPGQSYTTEVSVTNTGSKDYDFKMLVSPYTITNENYDQNFTTKNDRTQISDWITFPNGETYHAPAKQQDLSKQKVPVKVNINVPLDAIAGGQYATIFAETTPSQENKQAGVTLGKRVGALVFGSIAGDTFVDGNIFDQKLDIWYQGDKIATSFKASNNGNIDDIVRYQLKVSSLFGGEIFASDANATKSILPNTTRLIPINWEQANWGIYKVEITQQFAGQNYNIQKLVLVAPLWLIVLIAIALILLIAIIILVSIRRRKRKRARAGDSTTVPLTSSAGDSTLAPNSLAPLSQVNSAIAPITQEEMQQFEQWKQAQAAIEREPQGSLHKGGEPNV